MVSTFAHAYILSIVTSCVDSNYVNNTEIVTRHNRNASVQRYLLWSSNQEVACRMDKARKMCRRDQK
jgi:hypothetical protein